MCHYLAFTSSTFSRWSSAITVMMTEAPVRTSALLMGSKAVVADIAVQYSYEGAERLDWRRTLAFGIFGSMYQGVFQYKVINCVFERLVPGKALKSVAVKTMLTNGLLDPLFFFPTFYIVKEAIATDSMSPDTAFSALDKYAQNYRTDIPLSWCLWLPGHTITYGLIPIPWRMPWMASVSFAYVSLLSLTRGKGTTPSAPHSP